MKHYVHFFYGIGEPGTLGLKLKRFMEDIYWRILVQYFA